MMVSFVRFVSMLLGEVATIAETFQAGDDNVQVEVESEEAGLMQKFLAKGPAASGPCLYNSNFEMHVRSLIAALEMSPKLVSQKRALAVMDRFETQG